MQYTSQYQRYLIKIDVKAIIIYATNRHDGGRHRHRILFALRRRPAPASLLSASISNLTSSFVLYRGTLFVVTFKLKT